MLKHDGAGWGHISIGDWSDRCSYLDDVPYALLDAVDELQIMQLLGRALSEYEIAAVPCRKAGRQTNTNRKGTSLIHKRL